MLCPSPFEFLFLELCFNDPFRINAAWMLSFAVSFLLLWIELRSNFLSSQEFNFKYFCRTLCSLTNDIQCCSSLVIFCYLFWISEISLFVKIIGFVIHKLPLLLRIHKAAWEVNDNTPRKCQMPHSKDLIESLKSKEWIWIKRKNTYYVVYLNILVSAE